MQLKLVISNCASELRRWWMLTSMQMSIHPMVVMLSVLWLDVYLQVCRVPM